MATSGDVDGRGVERGDEKADARPTRGRVGGDGDWQQAGEHGVDDDDDDEMNGVAGAGGDAGLRRPQPRPPRRWH